MPNSSSSPFPHTPTHEEQIDSSTTKKESEDTNKKKGLRINDEIHNSRLS